MTRKTIYRLMLATLLLPNFTAYWWMLPRRFKRCRTWKQAVMQIAMRQMDERISREWRRTFEVAVRFRENVGFAPISAREYRIPFQVTSGESGGWVYDRFMRSSANVKETE